VNEELSSLEKNRLNLLELPARILDEADVCPLRAWYILQGYREQSTLLLSIMRQDEKLWKETLSNIRIKNVHIEIFPPNKVTEICLQHCGITFIFRCLPDVLLHFIGTKKMVSVLIEFTRTHIVSPLSIKHIIPRTLLYSIMFYTCFGYIPIPVIASLSISSPFSALILWDNERGLSPFITLLNRKIVFIKEIASSEPKPKVTDACNHCVFRNTCWVQHLDIH